MLKSAHIDSAANDSRQAVEVGFIRFGDIIRVASVDARGGRHKVVIGAESKTGVGIDVAEAWPTALNVAVGNRWRVGDLSKLIITYYTICDFTPTIVQAIARVIGDSTVCD
jgi:hypothetical protein